MKAPPFGYVRATALADVFRLQTEAGGDCVLLAGGQSLLAALAFRLSEPKLLVDISRVGELKGVKATANGTLRVGALTTHAELGSNPLIAEHVPLLAEAAPLIAHPAIRNRGTIGGSLAYADPAAELPACAVALDAVIIAVGPTGERRVPAAEFFTGLLTTALAPGELIAAVEFPVAATGQRTAILELARRSGDYAMAGIVARAIENGGVMSKPRFVFFAVGATPVEAKGAAAALGQGAWSSDTIKSAQAALDRDLDPPADANGSRAMKRHLARVLLARAMASLSSPGKTAA